MDLEAANRDPRDQISYSKKDWVCPCNGCKKAKKQALQEVYDILYKDNDLPYNSHLLHEYLMKELRAK